MPYLTGTPQAGKIWLCLPVTPDRQFIATILGQLHELTFPATWEKYGVETVESSIEHAAYAIENYQKVLDLCDVTNVRISDDGLLEVLEDGVWVSVGDVETYKDKDCGCQDIPREDVNPDVGDSNEVEQYVCGAVIQSVDFFRDLYWEYLLQLEQHIQGIKKKSDAIVAAFELLTAGIGELAPIDEMIDFAFGMVQQTINEVRVDQLQVSQKEAYKDKLYCLVIESAEKGKLTPAIYQEWTEYIDTFLTDPLFLPWSFGAWLRTYAYERFRKRWALYSRDPIDDCAILYSCAEPCYIIPFDKIVTMPTNMLINLGAFTQGEGINAAPEEIYQNAWSDRIKLFFSQVNQSIQIDSVTWWWTYDQVHGTKPHIFDGWTTTPFKAFTPDSIRTDPGHVYQVNDTTNDTNFTLSFQHPYQDTYALALADNMIATRLKICGPAADMNLLKTLFPFELL